ncbi:MAG: hypothetical protein PWP27_48 [Clostridiales bacterium]|jgi:uncharacterized protein YbbK (DUF523 family)|nr:hypothetical protein [Clostridiales bacterium]MDK2932238.1 hypothetical protein [Clostridiales bacterium]
MILVSACLCGINCKYNGGNNLNSKILELYNKGKLIPICPEQLGGLPTPRAPREIINGNGLDVLEGKAKILDKDKKIDNTKEFIRGAQNALKISKALNIKKAILKQRSPSCGFGQIYDGSFSGRIIKGNGVTAELLHRNGIQILTEEDF